MRIVFGSTVPGTLDQFMRGQLLWLAGRGLDVHAVSSPGPELQRISEREGVETHTIQMERDISPPEDARALAEWVSLLRQLNPAIVVVGTPKAGLLGGTAARWTRVPRRVYLLRGARFEGASGTKRRMLRLIERASCTAAHSVIAVSQSLANLAVRENVVPRVKVRTVASGSSNGVDTERFRPPSLNERITARKDFGLAEDDIAIAYVGRLHPDKGLDVLKSALGTLGRSCSARLTLLAAGSDEGIGNGDFAGPGVAVRRLGRINNIPDLLHASDLLALPTQREGFPNVVLEAAAAGLPVVTTDATGAVDSVVDGVTGFVVPKRDGAAFGRALGHLAMNQSLRLSMGAAARDRVVAEFTRERVWRGMLAAYLGEPA